MAHPLTSHTPLACGFAKGLPAEMVAARAGPWKTHRKPHARAALRRAGEGTEPQGSTTGLPTGTGSTASNAMDAGRDAAMLVAPVHEALM